MFADYLEGGKVPKRFGIEHCEAEKQLTTEKKSTVLPPKKSEKQTLSVPEKTIFEKTALPETSSQKTSEAKTAVTVSGKSTSLVQQKAPTQEVPKKSVIVPEKQNPDLLPKEEVPERNKNALLVSAFGGYATTYDGGDATIGGLILEYRRTLADSRCNDCDLGNRLILSLKIGYGGGEDSEDDGNYSWSWDGYGSYKCDEITQAFATGGLIWQHQISRNVSVMFGGFAGVCQTEVEFSGTRYNYYYDYYYGYGYSYYDEYFESDSGVSFCYGASVGISIEFGAHHSLEISAEILGNKADMDLPDWEENQITGFLRLSYGYHF